MRAEEKIKLIKHRLNRSEDTLAELEILIENEMWHNAISRLYYACFYAVNALLISKGVKAQTHAGVRQMFGLHFIKTGIIDKELGKYYSNLFDKRLIGDYDDFIDFTKEEVLDLVPQAHQLVQDSKSLLDV